MYRLYVIPGSHACRSAMLMLEHKGIDYRRVDIVTLLHPVVARLHGFGTRGERRNAGGRRTFGLRFGDRLATVPALAAGPRRVSTNHAIARFLDQKHPHPPLFPPDPEQRKAVEEVERWANETLQMSARRVLGAAVIRDPAGLSARAEDGRLGYLLYKRRMTRRLVIPWISRNVFLAGGKRDPIEDLPPLLDRVDGWIEAGLLGGAAPNAADFMVVPSLALMLYRPDVASMLAGRPALGLVDRWLPDPAAA